MHSHKQQKLYNDIVPTTFIEPLYVFVVIVVFLVGWSKDSLHLCARTFAPYPMENHYIIGDINFLTKTIDRDTASNRCKQTTDDDATTNQCNLEQPMPTETTNDTTTNQLNLKNGKVLVT